MTPGQVGEHGHFLRHQDKILNLKTTLSRVIVSIQSPNITNANLTGMVKIININDESDFCIIEASLNTTKIKEKNYFQYFKHFEYFIKWIREFDKFLI